MPPMPQKRIKLGLNFNCAFPSNQLASSEDVVCIQTPLRYISGDFILVYVTLNLSNLEAEHDYVVSDLRGGYEQYQKNPQLQTSNLLTADFLEHFGLSQTEDGEIYTFCDELDIEGTVVKLSACINAIEQAQIRT